MLQCLTKHGIIASRIAKEQRLPVSRVKDRTRHPPRTASVGGKCHHTLRIDAKPRRGKETDPTVIPTGAGEDGLKETSHQIVAGGIHKCR